jgi:uncharacterized protein YydD (DUF2326 family)
MCFVLSLGLAYAQVPATISSIDQALIELNNLEQNQIALKNLLVERETTIAEKEKLLAQMTLQYQNLDSYCSLLKNENKFIKIVVAIVSAIAVGETGYIVGDRIFNWW